MAKKQRRTPKKNIIKTKASVSFNFGANRKSGRKRGGYQGSGGG
jgi:hypothetical protein